MPPRPSRKRLTVAERLRQERRGRFVGRTKELELFGSLLNIQEPDFCLLWVHGPGGVGKTALCGVFAQMAHEAGRRATTVDGRDVELTRSGLTAALSEPAPGQVVIIDTFDRCAPLEGWLRESLLPTWAG